MKLSDYICKFLSNYTNHVFSITGGCVITLLDSIDKCYSIKNIPCQNEQGASIAAEAYSRVKENGLGVALATSGPGMINMMQGIASAHFDSIPVLYISGAPPLNHLKNGRKVKQFGFQEMDVVDIVKPITKYAVLLKDPNKIKYELEKLIYMAYEGNKGPVLLDIPDDIQRIEIDPKQLEPFVPVPKFDNHYLIDNQITETINSIERAKRPVVIVGGGVKIGNVEEKMKDFLNFSSLPFVTTWSTIDLFTEDNDNLIGNFGISSNRYGNFAVQNADLIISFGSRLDTHQTGSDPSKFAPNAKKIVINIDNNELYKDDGVNIDLKICCDLDMFLTKLNGFAIDLKDITVWKNRIVEWKEKYPICLPEYYNQEDSVNPYVFMNELSKETNENDIIITDAGATLTWTMQSYKIRNNQKLFSAFNHSPMGYSLPASIGAQFAAFGERIVCITGDGGMCMNIQELETIVYNNLPVKIFLINNKGYGIIRQTQDTWMNSNYVGVDKNSGLGFPNIKGIAQAYGVPTIDINDHSDLNETIRYVLNYDGYILCNVNVKPDEQILPKLVFGHGIEDMSPLLPRDELKEIMNNEENTTNTK
jgi:acetolactate synthase-1/2/3 large subunit